MDSEEYRKQLERNILLIMEEKLQNGEMDADRAKAIARMLLDKLHPPLSLEQIYEIAPTLDDHFQEIARAILPVMHDREEETKKIVSHHAEKLILSGKFDEALAALKQANKPTN